MSKRRGKSNLAPLLAAILVVILFRTGVINKYVHVPVLSPPAAAKTVKATGHTSLHGTLSCKQLEQLWVEAGGSPSTAFIAAEVAKAESAGVQDPPSNAQYNSNGKTDVGYWQINSGYHPSLATTDPIGNAKAAISISNDGTNWNPWITYQHGAEVGQC